MCDGAGDADAGDSAGPTLDRRRPRATLTTCNKCTTGRSALITRQHGLCQPCAVEDLRGRASLTISRNGLIRAGDHILIAVSGGAASRLAMYYIGLKLAAPYARLPFTAVAVHVDMGLFLGHSDAERAATRAAFEDMMRAEPTMPFDWVAAESAFAGDEPAALLCAATSETAREDLATLALERALVLAARAHGASRILVGDTTTRVGIRALVQTVLGRGASVPGLSDVAEPLGGADGLTVIRPLRELSAKEAAWAAHVLRLETVTVRVPAAAATRARLGIAALLETFVRGLQVGFPSTTAVVMRTAVKLARPDETAPACRLCLRRLLQSRDETALVVQAEATGVRHVSGLCHGCAVLASELGPDGARDPTRILVEPSTDAGAVSLDPRVKRGSWMPVQLTQRRPPQPLAPDVASFLLPSD